MKPIFIENFLPAQLLNFLNSYCIIKYSNLNNYNVDPQVSSLIGVHGCPVMETLMDLSTPVIEQNLGKKLWPTYSYFRIYDKGSDLKIHTDRESCEYTVALCLGCEPLDQPYEIFIGEKDDSSDYKYFEGDALVKCRIDHKFSMKPNNALIFKGMEKIHWREICKH